MDGDDPSRRAGNAVLAPAAILAAAVLLSALSPAEARRARPRKAPQRPKAAVAAPAPASFDTALYRQANADLDAGRLEAAVRGYCAMLDGTRGTSWSLSVALLCDAATLARTAGHLRESEAAPVFVLLREHDGQICYRLCLGLASDRAKAAALLAKVPADFKRYKPFPFSVKEACATPEAPTPVPPAPGPGAATTPPPAQAVATATERPPAAPPPVAPPAPASAAPGAAAPAVAEPPPTAPAPPPKGETAAPEGTNPSPALTPVSPVPPAPAPASPATPSGETLAALRESAARAADSAPLPSAEAESWFQKGLEAYGRRDRMGARRCYEESLRHAPDKPETLNNLAVIYLEEKRFEEARGLLEHALQTAPNYARAHLNLAGALWGTGERAEAIVQARRASELEQGNAAAHLTLASFLAAAGRRAESVAEAKVVLALEPGNAQAQAIVAGRPVE